MMEAVKHKSIPTSYCVCMLHVQMAGLLYYPVIFLPVHPASFGHKFVSGMQRFYFSESQDAMVLQTCHEK